LETSLSGADPQKIRTLLIAWGRQFFHDAGLYNLDDLARRLNNPQADSLCRHLQAALYAKGAYAEFGEEQRQALLELLQQQRQHLVRDQQQAHDEQHYGLPPLYKFCPKVQPPPQPPLQPGFQHRQGSPVSRLGGSHSAMSL